MGHSTHSSTASSFAAAFASSDHHGSGDLHSNYHNDHHHDHHGHSDLLRDLHVVELEKTAAQCGVDAYRHALASYQQQHADRQAERVALEAQLARIRDFERARAALQQRMLGAWADEGGQCMGHMQAANISNHRAFSNKNRVEHQRCVEHVSKKNA